MGSGLNSVRSWATSQLGLLSLMLILGSIFWGCESRRSLTPAQAEPDTLAKSPARVDATPRSSNPKVEPVLLELVDHESFTTVSYRNGEEAGVSSIVESLGGGIGIADFDRDGWPDVVVPGGGYFQLPSKISGLPTQLLRGAGNLEFTNVSQASRISPNDLYSHGVAIADFDNDGFSDCLVTGYGGLKLWHNLGDGTFADVTAASQLNDKSWSSSAAWGDFNNDGQLDLYICHYADWSFENNPSCPSHDPNLLEICSPREFKGLDDTLYLNDGAGGFSEATQAWGLLPEGKGLGVVAGDVNGDGRIDVYVANDTVDNFLYINTGNGFEEVATVAGVAVDDQGIPNGSMGVDMADYNGDLRPDLWVANYERESFALYRNEGAGLFLHVSRPTGITALGGLFVGFGTAFLDADGDGDLDITVANGHVIKYPQFSKRQQKPLLLINDQPRFLRREFPSDHYFEQLHEGRGLATGDLDRDGHLDVIVSHLNGSPSLLRSTLGAQQRSLSVHLSGRQSNRSAIGAQAVLECDQGKLLRTINGGGSYLSTHEPLLLFEIPRAWEPKQLSITWPSGAAQIVEASDLAANSLLLVEPEPG